MPQLRFVNVTKRFGKVLALDRISLEVNDGEYLCILGPNGEWQDNSPQANGRSPNP